MIVGSVELLLLISTVTFFVMGTYALRYRGSPGALPFVLASTCCAVWSLVSMVELLDVSPETRILLNRVRFCFMVPMPVLWLIMALEHTTQSLWLTSRRTLTLFVVPLLSILLCVVEDRHTLLRHSFMVERVGELSVLRFVRGPWARFQYLYSYVMMLSACVVLARSMRCAPPLFRSQSLCLLVGLLTGTACDVLFVAGYTPTPGVSLAPAAFAFSNGLMTWALLRHRALDIKPIARSTVIDHVRDPMVVFDGLDRLVDLNPAAASSLGLDLGESVGKTAREVLAVRPSLLGVYTEGGGGAGIELGGRYYDAARVPLTDGSGRSTGHLLVLSDITQRRQIEENLRESEMSLRRAKEEAEAASRAKSAFLANMSHEIRTPLTGVIGTLELLLSMALGNEQEECARTSLRSAEALLTILNDILHLSKLESGKLELESLPFAIEALVGEVADLFLVAMQVKGLTWEVAVSPDVPRLVRGDSARLRQVLTNLVGNAVKFTETGGVHLEVERIADVGGRLRLGFTISDTGIGLSEEQQAVLFRPFTQADASHSRRFGGTGLGLAICRSLCEHMEGEIGVSSAPGKGSAFRFTVMLDEASTVFPEISDADTGDEGEVEAERFLRGRYRVLVAEDDATTRDVVRKVLLAAGLRLTFAGDGEESLRLLGQTSFDLVLMDCQMPRLDGWEATRRLRAGEAGESNRDVPVIAFTASAVTEEVARCRAAGMVDFLPKPFKQAALLRMLQKWLVADETPRASDGVDLEGVLDDIARDLGFSHEEGLQLLRAYFDALPGALDDESCMRAGGRIEEADLLLHRLRGGAANLRLHDLRVVFAAWEQGIRGGDGTDEAARERVRELAARYAEHLETPVG